MLYGFGNAKPLQAVCYFSATPLVISFNYLSFRGELDVKRFTLFFKREGSPAKKMNVIKQYCSGF